MPATGFRETGTKDGPVAILGAGSLGRLWAGSLPAGDAFFITRPDPDPGSSTRFLSYRLQSTDGTLTNVSIPCYTPALLAKADSGIPSPRLLLVTTKAGDTLPALEGVLPALAPDVPVVLFQNGMGSQQSVVDCWPDRPILAASTTEGANRPKPDLTVHAGRGQTWVGALTNSARDSVAAIVQRLASTGFQIHPESDILLRLWQKLVVNAGINPFTAILDCPNGDILSAPFYQSVIDALCREISAVMTAEGLGRPAPGELKAQIENVARNTAANTSSMRSDMQMGRRTEIDFINGFLVQRGNIHGLDMAVNQLLTDKVKAMTEGSQQALSKRERNDG